MCYLCSTKHQTIYPPTNLGKIFLVLFVKAAQMAIEHLLHTIGEKSVIFKIKFFSCFVIDFILRSFLFGQIEICHLDG